jgi:hypothetical protein
MRSLESSFKDISYFQNIIATIDLHADLMSFANRNSAENDFFEVARSLLPAQPAGEFPWFFWNGNTVLMLLVLI